MSKQFVETSILQFINIKCKEAADFFCSPLDADGENDTIMNNTTFYKRHPEVFVLQSRIMQDERNFDTFTPSEKAIWFGLEPTRKNIEAMSSINPTLNMHNKHLIERTKLTLENQTRNSAKCIDEIYSQLKKGWGSYNSRISDIYNEGDGITPEFYVEIYDKIIYPTIQSRLKIYARMKNMPYNPLPPPQPYSNRMTSVSEHFEKPFYGLDASGIKKRKKPIRKTRQRKLKGKKKIVHTLKKLTN
jgi:regulator of replication initiation timing